MALDHMLTRRERIAHMLEGCTPSGFVTMNNFTGRHFSNSGMPP
jgi:hypothetical protein